MKSKKIKVAKGQFFMEAIQKHFDKKKPKVYCYTDEQLIAILVLANQIEDRDLRLSLIEKLGV